MKKYQKAIFDFDGVILNSHKIKTKLFYKIFSNYGKGVGKKALNFHLTNLGLPRDKKFKIINKKFLNNKLTNIDLKKIEVYFSNSIKSKIYKLKLNKNLLSFLKKNYKKKKLYISTGTNQFEIRKICKELKISKYFRSIYGSPKSKIFHINKIKKSVKKVNFKENIVFVGDSNSDYKAAYLTKVDFICKSNSENINMFKKNKLTRVFTFKQLYKKL